MVAHEQTGVRPYAEFNNIGYQFPGEYVPWQLGQNSAIPADVVGGPGTVARWLNHETAFQMKDDTAIRKLPCLHQPVAANDLWDFFKENQVVDISAEQCGDSKCEAQAHSNKAAEGSRRYGGLQTTATFAFYLYCYNYDGIVGCGDSVRSGEMYLSVGYDPNRYAAGNYKGGMLFPAWRLYTGCVEEDPVCKTLKDGKCTHGHYQDGNYVPPNLVPGMDKWYECGADDTADGSGTPLRFAPDFDQLPAPHLYPPPSYYSGNGLELGWNSDNRESIRNWNDTIFEAGGSVCKSETEWSGNKDEVQTTSDCLPSFTYCVTRACRHQRKAALEGKTPCTVGPYTKDPSIQEATESTAVGKEPPMAEVCYWNGTKGLYDPLNVGCDMGNPTFSEADYFKVTDTIRWHSSDGVFLDGATKYGDFNFSIPSRFSLQEWLLQYALHDHVTGADYKAGFNGSYGFLYQAGFLAGIRARIKAAYPPDKIDWKTGRAECSLCETGSRRRLVDHTPTSLRIRVDRIEYTVQAGGSHGDPGALADTDLIEGSSGACSVRPGRPGAAQDDLSSGGAPRRVKMLRLNVSALSADGLPLSPAPGNLVSMTLGLATSVDLFHVPTSTAHQATAPIQALTDLLGGCGFQPLGTPPSRHGALAPAFYYRGGPKVRKEAIPTHRDGRPLWPVVANRSGTSRGFLFGAYGKEGDGTRVSRFQPARNEEAGSAIALPAIFYIPVPEFPAYDDLACQQTHSTTCEARHVDDEGEQRDIDVRLEYSSTSGRAGPRIDRDRATARE